MVNPSDDTLLSRFSTEFNELSTETNLHLEISPLAAFTLLSQLQLAFRHPGNTGSARLLAEDIARQLQKALCLPGSALHEIAERGWHQEFDLGRKESEDG